MKTFFCLSIMLISFSSSFSQTGYDYLIVKSYGGKNRTFEITFPDGKYEDRKVKNDEMNSLAEEIKLIQEIENDGFELFDYESYFSGTQMHMWIFRREKG